MPTELDPREITAAHVGFLGEGFLAQTTGCPQLPEPLHQGVHTRHSVTYPVQLVNWTFGDRRCREWPKWPDGAGSGQSMVTGRWAESLPGVVSLTDETAVGFGGRGATPCGEGYDMTLPHPDWLEGAAADVVAPGP